MYSLLACEAHVLQLALFELRFTGGIYKEGNDGGMMLNHTETSGCLLIPGTKGLPKSATCQLRFAA